MKFNWHTFHFVFRVACITIIVAMISHHVISSRMSAQLPQQITERDRRGEPGYHEFMEADNLLQESKKTAAGNNKAAVRLAGELSTEIKDLLPRAQVYILKNGKYCVFMIRAKSLTKMNDTRRVDLADELWPIAQKLAIKAISGYPTIGLALRTDDDYGPIYIGGRDGKPVLSHDSGSYVLYPYFQGEASLLRAVTERHSNSETAKQ